jgi:deazaflavin-dependent oxidoreductase (nitroreductase family)
MLDVVADTDDPRPDEPDYCYVHTVGRKSGKPHDIEIWFARVGDTIYILAGNHNSDWVLNLLAAPRSHVKIGSPDAPARPSTMRSLKPGSVEDQTARRVVVGKYSGRGHDDLAGWGADSRAIALDLI